MMILINESLSGTSLFSKLKSSHDALWIIKLKEITEVMSCHKTMERIKSANDSQNNRTLA